MWGQKLNLNTKCSANQLLSQTFTIKLWCMINWMSKLVLWVVKVYNRSFSWQSRQNWTWSSAIKCWSIQTFPSLMTHYNVLVIPIIGEGNGNVYWWKWSLTAAWVHSMHIIQFLATSKLIINAKSTNKQIGRKDGSYYPTLYNYMGIAASARTSSDFSI